MAKKTKKKTKIKLVEVARSFSRKINLGNYETADFFCSQKAEATEKDAKKVSKKLAKFCEEEVMKSVGEYGLNHLPIPKSPNLTKTDFIEAKKEAPKSEALEERGQEWRAEEKDREEKERSESLPIIEE